MMLAASKGTVLELSADGSDEHLAIERIEELVQNRFGEES
jgi:phosphotransferase system HPr-like phosphotransfer protein